MGRRERLQITDAWWGRRVPCGGETNEKLACTVVNGSNLGLDSSPLTVLGTPLKPLCSELWATSFTASDDVKRLNSHSPTS